MIELKGDIILKKKLTNIVVMGYIIILLLLFTGCASKNNDAGKMQTNLGTPTVGVSPDPTLIKNETTSRNDNALNEIIIRKANLFIINLKNNDLQYFKQLVSPNGLIIIRNFVSGGNGTRGKDIRDYYVVNNIPPQIQFPVQDEVSINPKELFQKSLNQDMKNITVNQLKDNQFKFMDNGVITQIAPSTSEVINLSARILSSGVNSSNPQIFVLGDSEFIIAESQLINGLPLGAMSLFEKNGENYYLRAIMDFR